MTDPEENTTSYSYDELNRTLSDTNQLGFTRSYSYDEVDNVVQTSDRNGRDISYSYDKLNRNTQEVWLDQVGSPVRTFNFQYDGASQLKSASDPDSTYTYDYDLDGRVTSVNNAGTPGVPNVVLNYSYDPVDNLTRVTDRIDGVARGVEEFSYDELDRVTSITQSGEGVSDKRVDMSYDSASQMTGISRYSDLEGRSLVVDTNYTYDDDSRLTEIIHQQNEATLAEFDLVYDGGDRITQFTTPEGVSEYSYDNSDRLLEADYDYQDDESYTYDSNGNRTNDGYVTGENNQLESDGTYNYEYDNEGNRVRQTEIATGEVTEYDWDYRNRLVDVETQDADGNAIANSDYTYDVFDNRIGKSVDADGDGAGEAVVERYVLDGDHIALTFDESGNQTERFLHGLGIDQVLAQENASGEVLWALSDHQGSTRLVLDGDGSVVNNITYDAFGNVMIETNDSVNFRFLYTGRESDPETGLNYNRGRYYDPTTGRFISIDPIGFAAGDSNLYRYVGNNPLFYVDPFGFCGVAPSGGDNGNNDGNNDFFGPGFGPDSTPSPSGDGGDDFWSGLSDFFFPPASAAEPPPSGFDSQFDTPNDNASDVIDNLDLNFDFPGDDSTEVALAVPIAVGVGIGLGILTIGEAYRRHLELQQELNKDDDGYEYYDWERYHQPLETTVKDNTGEFDSTIIDTFEGDFEINRDVERFPGADDFLDADTYEFPDGDDTTRIEPTRDFEDDFSDSTPDYFESSDGLTPAQRARIEKIDNTIKNHAKPHDFEGVKKELAGIDTGYDHITEMTEAANGLEKHIQGLEGSLKNPNLEQNDKKTLENARDKAQNTLNQMRETLSGG